MIGKIILNYPTLCRCTAFRKAERDSEQRDKILEKLGEACPAKGSRQARGGMSSFSRRYNKLIPHTGGVVYKADGTEDEKMFSVKERFRKKPVGKE